MALFIYDLVMSLALMLKAFWNKTFHYRQLILR